jgi:hypothetical protein
VATTVVQEKQWIGILPPLTFGDQIHILVTIHMDDIASIPQPHRLRGLDRCHAQQLPGGKDAWIAGLDLVERGCKRHPCLSKKVLQS